MLYITLLKLGPWFQSTSLDALPCTFWLKDIAYEMVMKFHQYFWWKQKHKNPFFKNFFKNSEQNFILETTFFFLNIYKLAPQMIDLKTQTKMNILLQIELHALLNTNLLGVWVWSNDTFCLKLSSWGVLFIFQSSLPFLTSIIFLAVCGVYIF